METVFQYFVRFFIILVLGVLFVGKSYGQSVLVLSSEKGGDRIVLETETKCTSKVYNQLVGLLLQGGIGPIKEVDETTYVWMAKKTTVPGCAAIVPHPEHGDIAFMLFEDGDTFAVPLKAFKPGDASQKKVGFWI